MNENKSRKEKKLTDAQHYVLGYMDQLNLGTLFSDVLQQWIWRNDVRNDNNLAIGLIAEKGEIANYVRKIINVKGGVKA